MKRFLGTPEPSLYTIKAILILDNDGERIVAKYYDDSGKFSIRLIGLNHMIRPIWYGPYQSSYLAEQWNYDTLENREFPQQNWKCIPVSGGVKEQKAFEKTLFNKTAKSDAEILLLDGLTIVFKSNVDLLFYVIGSSNENELLLNT